MARTLSHNPGIREERGRDAMCTNTLSALQRKSSALLSSSTSSSHLVFPREHSDLAMKGELLTMEAAHHNQDETALTLRNLTTTGTTSTTLHHHQSDTKDDNTGGACACTYQQQGQRLQVRQ